MNQESTKQLPNRFDYAEAQDRIYQRWEQAGYFHAEPDESKQPFSIVIPPPNVTGALHLGHALNNTLQDVLIRMKRMQGFNAMWMPGTDHAGIATQAVVEKRLREEEGKTRHDLGREKLVERIWQWKDQYEARILNQLKRMGCSCDWDRTRFTLDDTCARAVRSTFFDLCEKGLIYRGNRLVNWDTYLQTAVSDDEVFHEEVKGHFYHFRYPVIDPKPGEPTHVTIATTRPETMLGDTAVAVHPDPAAALDKLESELRERLTKTPAKEREGVQKQIDNIVERRSSMLPSLLKLRDMARDGRMLELPLTGRQIPLICDEWAKPELGSGAVKITPAHDPNDYEVWQRNPSIGAINILNPDGTLNENAGAYQGQTMMAGRKRVVADLESRGLVVEIEDRLIDLAHSDRSKTPIEPYLADQWFVKMDQLAQSAMDAVTDGRVEIYPPRYGKAYHDWLGEKRDWCISRNLWWGHRIPVWRKRRLFKDAVQEQPLLLLVDLSSVTASTEWSGQRLKPEYREFACDRTRRFVEKNGDDYLELFICVAWGHTDFEQQLKAAGFQQDEEVLDTWFSSALWPHSTLGWPGPALSTDDSDWDQMKYFYPTSTLITSRDIITLWVARMVLMGLNNVGDVPFREVFIHPKILDGYGETMSKSKGNGVDPLDVIDKFGPDALRFGLAMLTTETQDVRMPVQFECPHCETLIDQTKENRERPRIKCGKCGKEFSTQWARAPEDQALPRGPVVSERFEQSRNFCNKLWNASRFAMMNLEGYSAAPVTDDQLSVEDRWILSRLNTVTKQVTEALESYRYADAARTLYDFAWDEFCSFYIEMAKARLQDESSRAVAQRVLAHTLDTLLRLLHPMIPFITEEVWQLLGQFAPQRGVDSSTDAAESIMISDWPIADEARIDTVIEQRFAQFQAVLGALREIRSRQNIANRDQLQFCVRCEPSTAALLEPMQPYFDQMARATATALGPEITPPAVNAAITLPAAEVFVDLAGFIDVPAEIERNEKLREKLLGQIAAKEKKLSNANFVDRAPADVVQKERDSLADMQSQLVTVNSALEGLRAMT